jgi:putative transposase
MATQVLSRKQKGDMIALGDVEQINKFSFFVKSQTGKSGYAVTTIGQRWSCDCPDHRYRGGVECKHIVGVKLSLSRAGRSVGLWEASK